MKVSGQDGGPYLTDPSTRQGRRPMTPSRNCLSTAEIWSWIPEGLNAKTDWLSVAK